MGVIMTNTEIKFHILLFTLSSSSVSPSLSFNLLQSLYCPLSSVLTLCLQIKVWSFSVLSIRKDSGSLLSSSLVLNINLIIPDLKYLYCDLYILMNYLFNPYMSKEPIFRFFKPPPSTVNVLFIGFA